ncbi:MAG TPA: M20/M25/M40 family metallo-hydrolase [Aldersonia sp.]
MAVVFFDIGGTLADASIAAGGVLTFHPLPRVRESLADVSHERLGILSNPGPTQSDRDRAAAALAAVFGDVFTDPALLRWGSKANRAIFDEAVAAAGVAADQCVFVGEDAGERARAREAGLRCAAHPVFARAAVEDRAAFWARIEVPVDRSVAELAAIVDATEVVPARVGATEVLAMATKRGVEVVRTAGFPTTVLEPIDDTVAFLIRDDRPVPEVAGFESAGADDTRQQRAERAFSYLTGATEAFAAPSLAWLGAGENGVYVAAQSASPVEEKHIPRTGHGHCELLLPDPSLLSAPLDGAGAAVALDGAALEPSTETVDTVRRVVTAPAMRELVAQISGAAPLAAGSARVVRGRHIASPDNPLVVDELARRLAELGLSVRRQLFEWRGHRIDNVEAEFRVAESDAAVLVTGHIDSTAAAGRYVDDAGQPRAYDPATDPAPGADDDGSGAAAVIAAAQCLRELLDAGRKPSRTMRFVLFNAEEQGLVGSKVYARAAAAAGDRIAGVLQMDMIAGNRGGVAKVEVHAFSATPGPAVAASRTLGAVVADGLAKVVPEFEVQLLADASDPAAGRSDHASFHERGWAAVAVSENFFADVEPESGTQQYHMPGDTVDDVDHDSEYCAQIARAVAATALTLAGL